MPVSVVSNSEVGRRIKSLKPGSTPGPDGLRKANLLGEPGINVLLAGCLIFTYILIPTVWSFKVHMF